MKSRSQSNKILLCKHIYYCTILTEVQDQEGQGYKELDCKVPLAPQEVAQGVHVAQEQHHEVHEAQGAPKDLLDPVKISYNS